MKKEELAKHYANQKVLANPRNAFTGYSWDTQKKLTVFDGYEIEQAYEDGFDKAVELARDYLEEIFGAYCNKNNVIEVFLKTMEEGKA